MRRGAGGRTDAGRGVKVIVYTATLALAFVAVTFRNPFFPALVTPCVIIISLRQLFAATALASAVLYCLATMSGESGLAALRFDQASRLGLQAGFLMTVLRPVGLINMGLLFLVAVMLTWAGPCVVLDNPKVI